jgi:ATP-dependent RNA helicase DeaD
MTTFKDLGLNEDLLKGIETLGFETPTPVQELVIPSALTSMSDMVALAQTGTGKTAAFGLPLLQLIEPNNRNTQALVLCPTRELCVQVATDLERYSQFAHQYTVTAVYGGAGIETQIRKIKQGVQIIVATPGRLIDLIERRVIKLEHTTRIVLDESDEMLNMGFKDALDTILSACENRKSTWLFSATMSEEVRRIARNYMTDPIELTVGRRNQSNENIEHIYYVCRRDEQYAALKRVVDHNPGIFGLIFCRTKADTKEIADQMMRDGYNSDALHGDLAQSDRDRVMNRFREGSLQLLIATDVAARGIDVSNISHVIHYGFPDDVEVYTHRSGRTGRAGKKGVSIAIVPQKHESRVAQIERVIKAKINKMPIPSGTEVCERQLFHIVKDIHNTEVQQDAIEPYMERILEELKDVTREDLIMRFASVEFNRFLSYYKNAIDLNIQAKSSRRTGNVGGASMASPAGMARLFVNIGDLDGVNKKEFINLISQDFRLPAGALGQIDIKKSYMHFDIELKYASAVKEEFRGMVVNGRKVRIDDASPRDNEGGGGFGGGSREGGRSFGGFGGGKREGGKFGGSGNRRDEKRGDKKSSGAGSRDRKRTSSSDDSKKRVYKY